MATVNFSAKVAKSNPTQTPVLVVGLLKHLQAIGFGQVKAKLEPQVTEDAWNGALEILNPASSDCVSLYLNSAAVAVLPGKCSRHNTPSRAHSITKQVKSFATGQSDTVVVVCERAELYASGCAVVRAFSKYSRKTRNGSPRPASNAVINVEFICPSGDHVSADELSALNNAAHGIQLSAMIVDTPCNDMHTDIFLDLVRDVGKQTGTKCTVIQGEELNKRGMGGIYGVGKAAIHKPALAVLSYEPEGATETVAWVGKGIVYDTGGLSIKGKTGMPGMKRDCGGAAGILGAFYAAVKDGFTQRLHAVFCLAENAVGPIATRPDDIHTLYSGKTVEINNTDAEGRLVVSDGVVYADRDLRANIIVDMCTLTGAQGISTGKYHAAHLTNNEEWEYYASKAGRSSGDLSFPLVYTPEMHFPEFNSAVADMKNSVADRGNAQCSCAGLFINAHLGFDFPGIWLHIDMASPVCKGERATGYGVAMLNTLFGQYSSNDLLKEIGPRLEVTSNAEENGTESKSKKQRLG